MREAGVSYARAGELELRLEPLPPQPVPVSSPDNSPTSDPDDEPRRLFTDLLHSSGADPELFVEIVKRQRAA
jgi:hypothetical protein